MMKCDRKIMVMKTPFGWSGVAATEQGICMVVLPKKDRKTVERALNSSDSGAPPIEALEGRLRSDRKKRRSAVMLRAGKLLGQYFSGKPVSFDLPLDMRYYTAFQQAVWKAAGEIPVGETRSYGWIAKRLGNPKAARAVGGALGANPVPIIIPCHRVINSAGTLDGFSCGTRMKKKLLALETKRR